MRTEHWSVLVVATLLAIVVGALLGSVAGYSTIPTANLAGGETGTTAATPVPPDQPGPLQATAVEGAPPVASATAPPARTATPGRPAAATATSAATRPAATAAAPQPATPPPGNQPAAPTPAIAVRPYTIQEGDTLARLAKNLGVSVDLILSLNPGVQPEALQVGQVINLPLLPAASPTSPTATP